MEIIVCSDNHGLITPLEKIIKAYPHADAYIHCGDNELEPKYLEKYHAVTGNNDYFYSYPEELIVEVGNIKILVTHGHQYYGNRIEKLSSRAINNHCSIACYGHTHIYDAQMENGVLCLNPGSLRYNRDGTEPCFARISENDGKYTVERILVSEL